ncbi:hypothetical protein AFM12_09840 [Jiulongibacter sediminis]|uniref:Uncharacterized protein n=1 Tax=Jiulongibacter sediminis TaxID=1605367 RepID=A0A0P7BW16_9BACT|nr:hypothetical protein AFM12_09840 [Jiulongibacter sediminis]TBX25386.1 hypothetical protein TK44_09845 [Jiulongibacter sediminis]
MIVEVTSIDDLQEEQGRNPFYSEPWDNHCGVLKKCCKKFKKKGKHCKSCPKLKVFKTSHLPFKLPIEDFQVVRVIP